MTTIPHIVRVSNATDAAAVGRLLEASYGALLPAYYDEAVLAQILPLITRANPLLLNSGTFYVAVAGRGNLVACGGWSMKRPKIGVKKNSQGDIRHFATHPDWLRKGIGGDILRRCMKDAKAQKLQSMTCYSALGAETFYESCGFAIIEQIDVPITSKIAFPATLMCIDLST